MHFTIGRSENVVRGFLQINAVDAVQVDGSPENPVALRADNFDPVGAVVVRIQTWNGCGARLVQRYSGQLVGVGGRICDVAGAGRVHHDPGPTIVTRIETEDREGFRAADGQAVSTGGAAGASYDFARRRTV